MAFRIPLFGIPFMNGGKSKGLEIGCVWLGHCFFRAKVNLQKSIGKTNPILRNFLGIYQTMYSYNKLQYLFWLLILISFGFRVRYLAAWWQLKSDYSFLDCSKKNVRYNGNYSLTSKSTLTTSCLLMKSESVEWWCLLHLTGMVLKK